MTGWEAAGALLGWIVFAIVGVIALAVVVLIVGGAWLVIVSVWQTFAAWLRARRMRAGTAVVPMPTGPTPPGGAQ
ncbi:MAG: hypothetical protein AB7T06_40095 [Kofleriaceae bacterium]